MTYHLDSELKKIISKIKVIIIDSPSEIIMFSSGIELADYDFKKNYMIRSIKAEENYVIIEITENRKENDAIWKDKLVSFF